MLNLAQCRIIQNFHKICKLQVAQVAYQFRVEKPSYYPNRGAEMQRINEQMKSQLVAECKETKRLPKDYYYKILGIGRFATMQQIKTAYYALAKRFHPDAKICGAKAQQQFEEISNAYHILTDEAKRLEYDQLGVVRNEQVFLKQAATMKQMHNSNARQRQEAIIGMPNMKKDEFRNLTTTEPVLELTFLEAVHGVKKVIDFRYLKKCPTCNGKSQKMVGRSNPEVCRRCNGTGHINRKTPTYSSTTVCDHCMGKRYINRNQCETCDSRGFVNDTVKLVVHVPSGVKNGDRIPVENTKNNQRVNYRVQIKESSNYVRNGNDVYSDRYLTLSEAILGGTFKVRGIYEDLMVRVEPGTESHSKIVLRHKGIKSRDGTGDHIVTFKIRIPRNLSMKQRQLILAWAKTEDSPFENTT